LKNLKGQTVALLSYIDPFVAVLISFLMNEKMTFLQIIGGILIILGTILNEIKIKNIKYAQ
jgi:drug/metabolite transporter (DMT)-like permease